MRNLAIIALALSIIGFAQGSIVPKDTLAQLLGKNVAVEDLQQARADASVYFDQILANVREQLFLMGMNAIPLADQLVEFEQEVGGIVWHGSASLFNGTLLHMDTLHRTGVATITVEENGDLTITADVGVNKGTIHYEMIVEFMDLGPHCIIDGTLSEVQLLMKLRVDFSSMVVHLETFNIKSTGRLSVNITGLGPVLNFLVEIIVDFLGNLLKGIVTNILEGVIKDLINRIISEIIFPPDLFNAIRAVQAVVAATIS